jgi:hypothetical protein
MARELTFWLPLQPDTCVRVTLEVVEEPFGGLDQVIRREPSLSEMEEIAAAIADRKWSFTKP